MLVSRREGFRPITTNTARPAGSAGVRERRQDGCYDHISLSAAGQSRGASFRELVADLSSQVRTVNTTGKIQELRRQVAAGEYQISPREVAARMLLMEGTD